jgi:hypothetical protein
MSRIKLSWFLFFLASLIWATVFFKLSAFAAGEQPQQFVWTAQTQPIPGSAQVIEMKPTMLAPKGAPAPALRTLLTRVLGKSLGGLVGSAGIVYNVIDLEGQRQSVAYAYEQLQKNGQPVTIQMVHDWIAAQNGIDTSVSDFQSFSDSLSTMSSFEDLPIEVADSYLPSNVPGKQQKLLSRTGWVDEGHYWQGSNFRNEYQVFDIGYHGANPALGISYIGIRRWRGAPNYQWQDRQYFYYSNILEDSASAFDPENYPEIFGPDFFPSQAIDALVAQGLDSFDVVLDKVNGDLEDHVAVDVAAKYPTAETEWTEVYASNGQTYRIPIGALGGSVVPQYQAPSNSVDVQTASGQTTLSNAESQPFIDAGVPQGATIVQANPQTGAVTYINPTDGQAYTAQVSPSSVSNLTNNHAVYNTYNNSTEVTNIHQEISLPEVEVSGSIEAKNGSIEPVTPDRISISKQRFFDAWDGLKASVSGLFTVNLSGTGRLPVWHWLVLGRNVTIDFNQYANQLNWLSLAFVFLCTLGALFLVFGK